MPRAETFDFKLEASTFRQAESGGGKATVSLSFVGSGQLVGGTTASGTATFAYSFSAQGAGITCTGGGASMQTTGTVPFTLTISP